MKDERENASKNKVSGELVAGFGVLALSAVLVYPLHDYEAPPAPNPSSNQTSYSN